MLRKSLAVVGIVSAMVLASPAGALSFSGVFLDADRAPGWANLGLQRDRFGIHRGLTFSDRRLGSWEAPRHFTRDFGPHNRHGTFTAKHSWSNVGGRNCGPRPGSAVPEPGAALLFGAGALLVGKAAALPLIRGT